MLHLHVSASLQTGDEAESFVFIGYYQTLIPHLSHKEEDK